MKRMSLSEAIATLNELNMEVTEIKKNRYAINLVGEEPSLRNLLTGKEVVALLRENNQTTPRLSNRYSLAQALEDLKGMGAEITREGTDYIIFLNGTVKQLLNGRSVVKYARELKTA